MIKIQYNYPINQIALLKILSNAKKNYELFKKCMQTDEEKERFKGIEKALKETDNLQEFFMELSFSLNCSEVIDIE